MNSKKLALEKTIPNEERRKTPRSEPQKDQTQAQFIYNDNNYAVRILEVSLCGCKIATDAQLRVGDVIEFQSPDAIKGRVIWGQMVLFGIEFID